MCGWEHRSEKMHRNLFIVTVLCTNINLQYSVLHILGVNPE